MASRLASRRAAVELEVVCLPGVRALYPTSALPNAPRVALAERAGVTTCELRIAVDRDVPAPELIRSVTAAVRRATGVDAVQLHIELASID